MKILNCYNIEISIENSIVILKWKYYDDYNSDKNIILFQLQFESVKCFEILPRDVNIPKEENNCLRDIIYNSKSIEFSFMGV